MIQPLPDTQLGASYPTTSRWRESREKHPFEKNIQSRPLKSGLAHSLAHNYDHDLYIILARAPGAAAASALRRFGPSLPAQVDLDAPEETASRIARMVQVQRDT